MSSSAIQTVSMNSALTVKDFYDYASSTSGAFRISQLIEKVSKFALHFLKLTGSSLATFFESFVSKMSTVVSGAVLPRVPQTLSKAMNAVTNWSTGEGVDPARDRLAKIHDIADGAATLGFAGSFVLGNASMAQAAKVPDMICNLTDLAEAGQDYRQSSTELKQVQAMSVRSDADQQKLVNTMRLSLIKLVKAVSSIAGGILTLSPLTGLVLSLTSTVSAIAAHFFGLTTKPCGTMDYKNQPARLVTAAAG